MKNAYVSHLASAILAFSIPMSSQMLLFHSGFEEDVQIVNQTGKDADIRGADKTLSGPTDWRRDLENNSPIGNFKIFYEEGTPDEREARMSSDPEEPSNNVLEFWLNKPNVTISGGKKSRIQTNFYNNAGLKEFSFQVRMFFSKEWGWLRDNDQDMGWFLCSEYWNNRNWGGDPYRFRFNLHIEKHMSSSGNALNFQVRGQTWNDPANKYGEHMYQHDNLEFDIPVGEWFTLNAWVKEGDKSSGRYVLIATLADGTRHTIFDLHEPTHNPRDHNPDGFNHVNLLKAYGSSSNLNWVRREGGVLRLYWDDFALWQGKYLDGDIPGDTGKGDTSTPVAGPIDTVTPGMCITGSAGVWANWAFPGVRSTFSCTFEITPGTANLDGILALSDAPGISFDDYAMLVRFNPSGTIDVRNGDRYEALTQVAYTPAQPVQVEIAGDVSSKTYSVSVASGNSQLVPIAEDFRFRTARLDLESVSVVGLYSADGALEACLRMAVPIAHSGTDRPGKDNPVVRAAQLAAVPGETVTILNARGQVVFHGDIAHASNDGFRAGRQLLFVRTTTEAYQLFDPREADWIKIEVVPGPAK